MASKTGYEILITRTFDAHRSWCVEGGTNSDSEVAGWTA